MVIEWDNKIVLNILYEIQWWLNDKCRMIPYHPGWAVPCNAIPEATRTTSESLEPPGMAFLWQIPKENTFHTENT